MAAAPKLTPAEKVAIAAGRWAELYQAFDCIIVANQPARDRMESDAINSQMELATTRLLDAVAELES